MSYSLEDPVFRCFAFYAALSILKMFCCTFLTIFTRMTKGIFANQEDCNIAQVKKPVLNDDDVERIRRNHLNDIENIIPFVLVGFFYVALNPSYSAALWHFRIFFFSRMVHFITYQLHVQPFRGLAFGAGLLSTLSMLWSIISATM